MAIAKHTADAIVQNLTEYARRKWPNTHELVQVFITDNYILFETLMRAGDGVYKYVFTEFHPENTPAQILETRKTNPSWNDYYDDVPDCLDLMDDFEEIIHEIYRERQNRPLIDIPKANNQYKCIQSWFEVEIIDDIISIIRAATDDLIFECYIEETCLNERLSALESVLRRYEERMPAIENTVQRLPLPISQEILEYL